MEADYAVELGADDETLELPWAAADGGPRYFDLKHHPELLLNVEEASRVPELAELLVRRAFYHVGGEVREGFYITFYLFGYGDDEPQARQRWAIILKLVENAIRQVELM